MERRFGQARPVIYWMLNWMTMGAGEIFFPYCSYFHIAIVMACWCFNSRSSNGVAVHPYRPQMGRIFLELL